MKHNNTWFIILLFLFGLNACNSNNNKPSSQQVASELSPQPDKTGVLIEISPEQLLSMLKYDKNAFVIDVRKADKSIRTCKLIEGYQHIEDSLIYASPELLPTGKSIVLLSENGDRSRKLAQFLVQKGYTVYNLRKGMKGYWEWREQIIREKLNLYQKEIDVIELYADDFGC